MKVTKALVKQFEADQREFGTHVAIHNLVWMIAVGILADLGIKTVKTRQ